MAEGRVPTVNFLKRKSSVWGKKERGRRAWLCLADSGFNGEGVSQLDIVPPIRREGNIVDAARIARRELVDQARLDGVYGQRWKVETVRRCLSIFSIRAFLSLEYALQIVEWSGTCLRPKALHTLSEARSHSSASR